MRRKELIEIMRELFLTDEGLAELLGVEKGTVRSWVTGRRNIYEPVARLLRLFRERRDLMDNFECHASVDPGPWQPNSHDPQDR